MEATKWAHLPNAKHIDWVFNSVKTNPQSWGLVARDAARDAAYAAVYATVWDAAMDASWYDVRDAVLALVAYDDCEKYLDMTPDALRVWAALSNDPAAILLQPMVRVMQGELYENN